LSDPFSGTFLQDRPDVSSAARRLETIYYAIRRPQDKANAIRRERSVGDQAQTGFLLPFEGPFSANQKARAVIRDITARALPGIGPKLWQLAPGLGPPRSTQRKDALANILPQTVHRDASCRDGRPTGRLGGFPTGRPWDSLSRTRS